MPTNAIGTGTVNLALNIPRDERLLLGRLAQEAGAKSVGEFVRQTLLAGLAVTNRGAADSVKAIRRHYYGTMNVMLAILSLSALFTATTMRRPTRTARATTVRTVRSRKETV